MTRKNMTSIVWNKKKAIDCANFVKEDKKSKPVEPIDEKVEERYE